MEPGVDFAPSAAALSQLLPSLVEAVTVNDWPLLFAPTLTTEVEAGPSVIPLKLSDIGNASTFGALTVRVKLSVTVAWAASVRCTSNLYAPGVVGAPVMTPCAGSRVRPEG